MKRTIGFFAALAAISGFLPTSVPASAAPSRDGKAKAADGQEGRRYGKGERGKHKGARFAKADKNGDGYLTRDEVGEKRWSRISVADANKDKKVSKAELEKARKSGKLHKKGKRDQRKGKGRASA